MSPDATIGATPLLDLPSCQIWSPSVMSRRCSGTWNKAEFRAVREIGAEFAPLYLGNDKLYEKVTQDASISGL